MAVFAPMQSARVNSAATVNPFSFLNSRNPNIRSENTNVSPKAGTHGVRAPIQIYVQMRLGFAYSYGQGPCRSRSSIRTPEPP